MGTLSDFMASVGYDRRDGKIKALQTSQGGYLTRAQIMRAEFGCDGLPELGASFDDPTPILIKPMKDILQEDLSKHHVTPADIRTLKLAGLTAAGMAFDTTSLLDTHDVDERMRVSQFIYMNDRLFSPPVQAAIKLYWMAPILMTATSNPFVLAAGISCAAILGAVSADFKAKALNILQPVAGKKYTPTLGHEHVHTVQSRGTIEGYDIHTAALRKAQYALLGSKAPKKGYAHYLCTDNELQVRLHEVMVKNRNRWGKLPATRTELYEAMADIGLQPPKTLVQPASNARSGFFKKGVLSRLARKCFGKSEADLQLAVKKLGATPASERFFWQETLPFLYAHLCKEAYHCPDAFARMQVSQTLPQELEDKLPHYTQAATASSHLTNTQTSRMYTAPQS